MANNINTTVKPSKRTIALHSDLQDAQLGLLNLWLKHGPALLNGTVKAVTVEREIRAYEAATNLPKVGAVGMKLSAAKQLFEQFGSHKAVGDAIDERNLKARTISYSVRTLADELCVDVKKSRKSSKPAKSVGTLKAEMDKSASKLTPAQVDAWYAKHVAARNA